MKLSGPASDFFDPPDGDDGDELGTNRGEPAPGLLGAVVTDPPGDPGVGLDDGAEDRPRGRTFFDGAFALACPSSIVKNGALPGRSRVATAVSPQVVEPGRTRGTPPLIFAVAQVFVARFGRTFTFGGAMRLPALPDRAFRVTPGGSTRVNRAPPPAAAGGLTLTGFSFTDGRTVGAFARSARSACTPLDAANGGAAMSPKSITPALLEIARDSIADTVNQRKALLRRIQHSGTQGVINFSCGSLT